MKSSVTKCRNSLGSFNLHIVSWHPHCNEWTSGKNGDQTLIMVSRGALDVSVEHNQAPRFPLLLQISGEKCQGGLLVLAQDALNTSAKDGQTD